MPGSPYWAMRILLLGGPRFLGLHLIEAALDRGHQVTMVNRGKTNPDLFPKIERVVADRTAAFPDLDGTWDAVLDTCGYVPRVVGMSARALQGKVGQYTFISSISVYSNLETGEVDEGSEVLTLADPTVEEITGETYGGLKVLCEQVVAEQHPNTLIIRPGLIVGPHDPSDRFTYWPVRGSRQGRFLAPGPGGQQVQFIDVRDLAEWTIGLLEGGVTGVFNADGPQRPCSMRELAEACVRAGGGVAEPVYADPAWLESKAVQPWTDLPVWTGGEGRADISRALAAGLTFRPVEQTCRDTLDWWQGLEPRPLKTGLSEEREQELLAELG